MIIRNFKLSDLDSVMAIEYDSFTDPYPMGILVDLFNSGAGFIVVEVAHRVVAYEIFWIRNGQGHVIAIAVDSNYQNMGIGSLLLNKSLQILSLNHINSVCLEVRKSNIGAINFYMKNGFFEVKKIESYYSDGEDAIIMRKIISK